MQEDTFMNKNEIFVSGGLEPPNLAVNSRNTLTNWGHIGGNDKHFVDGRNIDLR